MSTLLETKPTTPNNSPTLLTPAVSAAGDQSQVPNPPAQNSTRTSAVAKSAAKPPRRKSAFGTIFKIEARVWLRDPTSIAMGLLFPLMMTLVIPAVTGLDVNFFLAPVLAMSMAAPIVLNFPVTFATFRETQVLRRFGATPMSPSILLGAHLLLTFCSTLVAGALAVLAAHLVFGLVLPINLGVMFLGYVLGMLATFGLGLLFAALMPRASLATAIGMLVFFALVILSGFMTPAGMPETLAAVARLTPLGAATQAMTSGMFGVTDVGQFVMAGVSAAEAGSVAVGAAFPTVQVIVMAVWALMLTPVAVKMFRWS